MKFITQFLFVLMALLIVDKAGAQQRIGMVGGANIAKLGGEDVSSSIRSGLAFGLVLDLGTNQNFVLRMEPMFLQKGAMEIVFLRDIFTLPTNLEVSESQTPFLDGKLTYLEMPVLLKFELGLRPSQPYLVLGPSVGLLLSGKGKVILPDGSLLGNQAANLDGLTNFIDFGLAIGAGLNLPLERLSIFIEAIYTRGLSRVFDEGKATAGDIEFVVPRGLEVESRGLQIKVGMTLPIGGY